MTSIVGAVRRAVLSLLEYIVIVLMGGLAVLVVVGVIFRKAGAALVWYDEIAGVMLAWLTYYGAALAALHRAHIGFPRGPQLLPLRWQQPVRALRTGLVLGFFAVTAWAGIRVLQVVGGSVLVSLPWVPLGVTQSVIPIGALLFIVAELLSSADRPIHVPGEDA